MAGGGGRTGGSRGAAMWQGAMAAPAPVPRAVSGRWAGPVAGA